MLNKISNFETYDPTFKTIINFNIQITQNYILFLLPFIEIVEILKNKQNDEKLYEPHYYINDQVITYKSYDFILESDKCSYKKLFSSITLGELKTILKYEQYNLQDMILISNENILNKFIPMLLLMKNTRGSDFGFTNTFIASLYVLGVQNIKKYENWDENEILINGFNAVKEYFEYLGFEDYEFALKNILRYLYISEENNRNVYELIYKRLFSDDINNCYISANELNILTSNNDKNAYRYLYFILHYLLHFKNDDKLINDYRHISYLHKSSYIPLYAKENEENYVIPNIPNIGCHLHAFNSLERFFKILFETISRILPDRARINTITDFIENDFLIKLLSYTEDLIIGIDTESKVSFSQLPIHIADVKKEDIYHLFFSVLIKFKNDYIDTYSLFELFSKIYFKFVFKSNEHPHLLSLVPDPFLKYYFDVIVKKLSRKRTDLLGYIKLIERLAKINNKILKDNHVFKSILI